MEKKINLVAGQWGELPGPGRNFVLLGTGAAPSVDLEFVRDNWPIGAVSAVERGFSLRVEGRISSVRVRAAVNAQVSCFLSDEAAAVSFPDSGSVDATIIGPLPLPVVNDRGAPGNPVYVSGVTYSDAPATAIVDRSAVAVTDAGATILAASATRKKARFCNLGPDAVTLGTTGHTWAKRCIVLDAGDVWIEEHAANLAWTAITNTATTASVTAQEVNA